MFTTLYSLMPSFYEETESTECLDDPGEKRDLLFVKSRCTPDFIDVVSRCVK